MGIIKENSAGRRHIEVFYKDLEYKDSYYTVMSILKNGEEYYSIIDEDDSEKVKKYSWHISSDKYISTAIIIDNKIKELYLHNLILNKLTFNGKGQSETVDHINRNPLDNRKKNLRILSQSEQNLNQKTKTRKIQFPENYPINSVDIPKHIWYMKENGSHGERFVIEFKTENILWKGTASKKINVKTKLNEAKEKLQELYLSFPHLNPDNQDIKTKIEELQKEYEEIISLI